MAVSVMILGVSGTGKSASMRNCKGDKFALVNVAKKPLPFKGTFDERYEGDNYQEVINFMKKCKAKSIVVDDAQYLMGNEFMRRVTDRGYDKFSEMAQNFWKLLNFINQELPADKIVYLLGHIERDADGNEKFKTMGKLIDQCINVEGMCTIVLKTHVGDGQYFFLTQNSGNDTVKSPIGMFPSFAIDNDLNYVDEKIRNYYELGEFLSDADIAEIDEAAAKVDFEPKKEGEKKSRRRSQKNTDNDSQPAAAEQPATETDDQPVEQPTGRKRRRVSDGMAEERNEVKEANATAVAESGLTEGDEDGIPFGEVDMPKLEEPPRRKRRNAEEPAEQQEAATEPMNPPASERPARRRRRG